MVRMTDDGRAQTAEIAARHGVTVATAERLAAALARTGGGQVQFDEPELGGLGQWSRGGMVMVGDMFNNALKARVDALCSDLAGLVATGSAFEPEAFPDGWPAELGAPSSSGAQNDMRYAVFPGTRRLAVARNGTVTIYDTGQHRIGGASQAQSGDQSLSFSSQLGPVRLADLPVVGGPTRAATGATAPAATSVGAAPAKSGTPAPEASQPVPVPPASESAFGAAPGPATSGGGDVLSTIERLAELASRGILTEDEFARKKAELLDRL
jgi:hypothetical protein